MKSFAGKNIASLLLCILLIGITSCAGKPEKVKIGVILPLSGRHSLFGDAQKKGYELALDEVNREARGRQFMLLLEDDGSDERQSVEAARRLIREEKVPALMGAYSSACTYSAIEIANYNKTPMVIPAAAADSITGKGFDYIFRINPPSSIYAKATVKYLTSLKSIRTAAVLHESSLFGSTSSQYILKSAKAEKLEIVFCTGYDEKNSSFISMLLSQVKKKNPDAVILVAYLEDAVTIMRECKAIDLNPKIFFGIGAGFSLPEFIRRAGSSSEYLFNVSEWSPDLPSARDSQFVKNFTEKYHENPTFHSKEAYVATKVLTEAIMNTRSCDRESIRKSLLVIDISTPYSTIKFETFDGYTNQNRFNLEHMLVQQVQGGRFVPVWPESCKAGEALFPVPRWSERKKSTKYVK